MIWERSSLSTQGVGFTFQISGEHLNLIFTESPSKIVSVMLLPGKNGRTEGEPVYTQIQIHDLQLLKDRKDPKLVSFVYSHLVP